MSRKSKKRKRQEAPRPGSTAKGRQEAARLAARADLAARAAADQAACRTSGQADCKALPEWDDNVGPDPWRVQGE